MERIEALEHDIDLIRSSVADVIRALEMLDAKVGEWDPR